MPYPLSLTRATRTSAGRCVIIGNAAQGLHPVAGMGFNLGLRDVASLAELIAERRHRARDSMPECPSLLAEYDAWRAADRGGVIAFTDGLVRLFANPLSAVRRLRNVGLLAFDLLPPAKAALSRLSTGAGGGRVPKLARGVRACDERTRARDFDVVIVGAGVIGAAMASLLLARKLERAGPGGRHRGSLHGGRRRRTPIGTCGYSR